MHRPSWGDWRSQIRLVLIGDVGGPHTYHVGDEAMLAANLAGFRRRQHDVQCTIISRAPDWSAREYGCEAISPIGFGCGHSVTEEQERLALLDQVVDAARVAKAERALPLI